MHYGTHYTSYNQVVALKYYPWPYYTTVEETPTIVAKLATSKSSKLP
jgi:hypothetical protein